jgi:hypothetical protein
MTQYVCLPGLKLPVTEYNLHPNLPPNIFAQVVLNAISQCDTEYRLHSYWFDIWDCIMTRFAHIETGTQSSHSPLNERITTIRGTVLNAADLVTDLANEVVRAAGIEYPTLRPFLQQYPNDIWDHWTVVDISESGILVEVNHEQRRA